MFQRRRNNAEITYVLLSVNLLNSIVFVSLNYHSISFDIVLIGLRLFSFTIIFTYITLTC